MMKIFNTLTRKTEEIVPISDNTVRMYACGPTVYNYAHIGNLRTYIFTDLFRRALMYNGFKLQSVMNITDVGHLLSDGDTGEDKMAKAAKEQKKTPEEIADYYTEVFWKDIDRLNILRPEIVAKATDHIKEMIDYVAELADKGYAYETSDGIYFDISKFSGYGKLSGTKLDDNIAGARVEINSEKRNPADFALWKKAEPNHIMQWDSPWGKGYPGWHIECSAMSRKYLGSHFDIHTGGVDHISIHHENEIAQNEALTGDKSVNYWIHGEFMLVDNGKMSKSLGNTYTIDNLIERGYKPLDFRYFCLNALYSKKLNFTFEGLDAARTSYSRLLKQILKHKQAVKCGTDMNAFVKKFNEAIAEDLNVPLALGILWDTVKLPPAYEVYEFALMTDKIFGLSLDKCDAGATRSDNCSADIPEDVIRLSDVRLEAKKNKDWAKADSIRAEITALGYDIKDTKDGVEIQRITYKANA